MQQQHSLQATSTLGKPQTSTLVLTLHIACFLSNKIIYVGNITWNWLFYLPEMKLAFL